MSTMKMRALMGGVCAVGLLAGSASADQFSIRGAQYPFTVNTSFEQSDLSFLGGTLTQNFNGLLNQGVLWEQSTSGQLIAADAPDAGIAASTFVGARPGVGTPTVASPSVTGGPTTVLVASQSPQFGLTPGDNAFDTGWVIQGAVSNEFLSAPGTLNGVSGDYMWLGQLVVAQGSDVTLNDPVELLIDQVSAGDSVVITGAQFDTAPDGSRWASFERLGNTFYYTIYKEASAGGLDTYSLYVSDVQAVPAPGGLALIGVGFLAVYRRR